MANIYYKSNGAWTQIQASDIGAAAASHTHTFADVSGVAAASHVHDGSDITTGTVTRPVKASGNTVQGQYMGVLGNTTALTDQQMGRFSYDSGYLYYTALNENGNYARQWRIHGSNDVTAPTVQYRNRTADNSGWDSFISPFWNTQTSHTQNQVLAAPSSTDGKATFRTLVKADLPSPFDYYSIPNAPTSNSSSINNNTSGYTSVGTTGWYVLRLSSAWVLATGYVSASVAINSAWGNWYRTSADRYLRLPVATTCIHYCSFGTYTGNSVMGITAQMSGSITPWVYNSTGYFHIPFRFVSPAAVATATTQRVPVLVILSAY